MFDGVIQKACVAKHCWHLVSCPWRTGVKPYKKVYRVSMMKSENTMRRKKQWSVKQKQKLHLFPSSKLRVPMAFEYYFGKPVLNTGTEACGSC